MFLGHTDPTGPWSARDRELAKALLLHEMSLCDGCNHPLAETLDPDREGWYSVETVTCAACRARDIETQKMKPEPGERIRIVADPGYEKRS